MGRGEYWRLIDSQGRPPGLLGMWPSRAVSFIENHDTGARLLTRSAAAVLCSMAYCGTARPCPPSSATEALPVGTLHADAPSADVFSSVICIDDTGTPSELYAQIRHLIAGSTLNHWPFPAEHLHAGYCYIITHPGSPCIFYDHFVADGLGQTIRELVTIRQKMRIHCRSKVRLLSWPVKPCVGPDPYEH